MKEGESTEDAVGNKDQEVPKNVRLNADSAIAKCDSIKV